MKIEMNKEQLEVIGKGAVKVGKAIIWEGTKVVASKGAMAVVSQAFTKGASIKDLKLDDYLRGGKNKKPKKSLFSFKKKKDETGDIVETEIEVEVVEAEIVEPKSDSIK